MLRSLLSVIPQGVMGQPIGSIFKGQEIPEDSLTIEGGTDKSSRNFGKELTPYAA